MPKITGAELFKKIKEFYPEIIRLMMSGYADFEVIESSINEGSIYKFQGFKISSLAILIVSQIKTL